MADAAGGLPDAESPRAAAGGADPAAGGAGADLLSNLPDDMLVQVLARLRCAREAVRSSILSRRWRDLWRRLPELYFNNLEPDGLDAALAQFTGHAHAVEYLDIHVHEDHRVPSPRTSSWLRSAANLDPKILVFFATTAAGEHGVVLPCFHRAREMYLRLGCALEKFEGDLTKLQELTLCGVHFDGDELFARCPRLRVLSVLGTVQDITIRSASLRDLYLAMDHQLSRLEVNAPNLKEVLLSNYSILFTDDSTEITPDPHVSLMIPNVEKLTWSCHFRLGNLMIENMSRLRELIVSDIIGYDDNFDNGDLHKFLRKFRRHRVQKLQLSIDMPRIIDNEFENLIEAIVELPIASFLEIDIWTEGHCCGPIILHLLSLCSDIDVLKVQLRPYKMDVACSLLCPCDEPNTWRRKTLTLPVLEQVILENFSGANHELDLMELLIISSPMLRKIAVVLSNQVLLCDEVSRRIINRCKSQDSSCYVYDRCGKLIAES